MTETSLSLWQKLRHWHFARQVKPGTHAPSVLLDNGELVALDAVEGFVWRLSNGALIDIISIRDAGDGKWLYKIYS